MNDFNASPKTLISLLPDSHCGEFSEQLLVSDIQTDSRKVSPGTLFIALQGMTDDGEKYISHATENGAVAVLVEAAHLTSVLNVEVPVVGVKNLKSHVADIAQRFFDNPSSRVQLVGVTGTNGKSTIVSLVAQIAAILKKEAATIGTLGYGLVDHSLLDTGMTTPDMVECQRILAELVDVRADVAAMEVSSHGIHQGRIDGLAFDVGVISNISHDHLDYHGSFEEYARVKKSFLASPQCAQAVVNVDDDECASLLPQLQQQNKPTLTYSTQGRSADISATVINYGERGLTTALASRWGSKEIFVPLVGDFNLGNVLAAVCTHIHLGSEFNSLVECLAGLQPVEGRLQRVRPVEESPAPSVFVDFAHTPDALEQVLVALRHHVKGRLWVVFGCGGDRDSAKRPLMGEIATRLADCVIVTSDNPRSETPQAIIQDIMYGVDTDKAVEKIVERELAISMAIGSCDDQDCVLIAGKGHEDYQIIKGKKLPFSDYLVAQQALSNRINARSLAQ